jgi:hypothetical protein
VIEKRKLITFLINYNKKKPAHRAGYKLV